MTSLVYYSYFIFYIRVQAKKDDSFPFTSVQELFPSFTKDKVREITDLIICTLSDIIYKSFVVHFFTQIVVTFSSHS